MILSDSGATGVFWVHCFGLLLVPSKMSGHGSIGTGNANLLWSTGGLAYGTFKKPTMSLCFRVFIGRPLILPSAVEATSSVAPLPGLAAGFMAEKYRSKLLKLQELHSSSIYTCVSLWAVRFLKWIETLKRSPQNTQDSVIVKKHIILPLCTITLTHPPTKIR